MKCSYKSLISIAPKISPQPVPHLRETACGLRCIIMPSFFAVSLADVHAEFHQPFVHNRLEGVGRFRVGRKLDGDRHLAVRIRGRTSRAVLLLYFQSNRAVKGNAIVGRFRPCAGEDIAQPCCRHLPHHAMRCNAVVSVRPLSGMFVNQGIV